jgi:hypothetical protein
VTNIEISQLGILCEANSAADQRSRNENYQADRFAIHISPPAARPLSSRSLKVGNLKALQVRNKNRRMQPPLWKTAVNDSGYNGADTHRKRLTIDPIKREPAVSHNGYSDLRQSRVA